ncbi:MAG: S-layer homology domain-containing protein, partial [Actinomycetota bacterium]
MITRRTRRALVLLAALAVSLTALAGVPGTASDEPAIPFTSDSAPPVPTEVSVTPTPVSNDGTGQIEVTITATDDISGVADATVKWISPSGANAIYAYMTHPADLTWGTATLGSWTSTDPIPQYAQAGAWVAETVILRDQADNVEHYDPSELAALGITVPDLAITGTPSDPAPPEPEGVTVVPTTVSNSGTDTVVVTLAATDDLSGLVYAHVGWESPSTANDLYAEFHHPDHLVSGNATDGVWEVTVTVPALAEVGTWTPFWIALRDEVGNRENYNEADFASLGLTVPNLTITGTTSDSTPPIPKAVTVDPASASNDGTGTIEVTLTATDDVAGLEVATVRWRSPSGASVIDPTMLDPEDRISGTANNGIWSETVNVPAHAETGTWVATLIQLDDAVGNKRVYYSSEFAALGFAVPDITITEPPPSGTFIDDDGSTFEADIEWLAAEGITKGCNPHEGNTRFCPDDPVTRGQMAAFLVRALPLTDRLANPFTDDDGSIFEADIERLAAAGITKGCNPHEGNTRFCPDDPVTRGQMAAFLVRALPLTDRLANP